MADKEEKIYLARLSEQAERYEEMVEQMKAITQLGMGLTQEERNLLSVAYKNVIGTRRASWRVLGSIEEDYKGDKSIIKKYKQKIETEVEGICNEILDLLDCHLIPTVKTDSENDENVEACVFYYKMKGDYLRYLAEFAESDEIKEASQNSLVAYKEASDQANRLKATHPIRLGLALNFSVFHYEILKNPDRACQLAKSAFDAAVTQLDNLSEENYKDSTLIMQLLRDNLTLWTSNNDAEGAEGEPNQLQDVEDQE